MRDWLISNDLGRLIVFVGAQELLTGHPDGTFTVLDDVKGDITELYMCIYRYDCPF